MFILVNDFMKWLTVALQRLALHDPTQLFIKIPQDFICIYLKLVGYMIPAYTKTIKQGGTTLTPIKPTLQREERYSQHTEYQMI